MDDTDKFTQILDCLPVELPFGSIYHADIIKSGNKLFFLLQGTNGLWAYDLVQKQYRRFYFSQDGYCLPSGDYTFIQLGESLYLRPKSQGVYLEFNLAEEHFTAYPNGPDEIVKARGILRDTWNEIAYTTTHTPVASTTHTIATPADYLANSADVDSSYRRTLETIGGFMMKHLPETCYESKNLSIPRFLFYVDYIRFAPSEPFAEENFGQTIHEALRAEVLHVET
ncbi:MAG: hypothetical protein LBM60_05420 [Clostridium sp.]|jgi:hypothetical protein|nr:hypothetical protein [Clostridium sp.]